MRRHRANVITSVGGKRHGQEEGQAARRGDPRFAGCWAAGGRSRPAAEDEAQGVRAGDEAPARRVGSHAGVGQDGGSQDLHRVRGPGHRREGRHDQADHRAGEPAGVPGRGPGRPDRAREVADVHPAVSFALPGRRRGRDLRPQLVQPGGRRAGDGLFARRRRPSGSSSWRRRSRRPWPIPGSCC